MEEIKELINLFHLFKTELEMTFLKEKDANITGHMSSRKSYSLSDL